MQRVNWGDTVQIEYTGWLEDGTVVDSSLLSGPLFFTVGQGKVLAGLEHLVLDMTPGESKTEKVPCQLAFGPYREELRCRVERSWLLAQDVKPEVGLGLEIRRTDGEVIHMRIVELNGDTVTLDANHRLAGQDLILHVELLAIPDRPVSGATGNGRSPSRVS